MKHTLSTLALVLFAFAYKSQNTFNCNSHIYYEQQLKNDPQFKKNQEQLEQETNALINSQMLSKPQAATYIIPVVFHIIHTGGSGNISDAQIIDQIAILNKEFKRKQADTILTPMAFKPLAAPFDVEFRLATIDPNGNCTNGINRVYSTLSDCSLGNDDVKALSYWPSNKYLNIWVVQVMHYSSSTVCDGGGYATFPGGSPNLDGINIRGDLIGNIGTAATNVLWGNFKGRYLIHELGHWFNLRHIWGDAVCGNDQVSDTPPAVFSNSNCPSFPYNPNNQCGSGPNGEMFMNYMDYTNGPCLNMFTAGQVVRMTAAITSPLSGRSNLISNSNLIATGTNDPYTYPVSCAAVPEILPYEPVVVCVGDSVKLTDISYGGKGTSRTWDFNGGAGSSTTDSIIRVAYSTPGIYSPSLTKTYLASTKTTTFTNKIYVLDKTANANYVVPFKDSLENNFAFANDWVVVDRNNDGVKWDYDNTTGFSPDNSASILNFGKKAPLLDDIITPAYDLTNVENPSLSFRLHYSIRNANSSDKLQILISNDCGNWVSVYSKSAGSLKTVNTTFASSHIPPVGSNEWRKENVNILPFLATGVVRFRFTFTSGGGNNIFIDDINVDGINYTSLKKNSLRRQIILYPNPTNNNLQLKYTLADKAPVSIWVSDISGRICYAETIDEIEEKEMINSLNLEKLSGGVYFVHIKQEDEIIFNAKFIKQASE